MLQKTVWATSNTERPLRCVKYYHKLQKQPLEELCKKGVLRNFATFTGKNMCQSLFFNKAEDFFRTPPDNCFQIRNWI